MFGDVVNFDYEVKDIPPDPLNQVLAGRDPHLLMDISKVSEVNDKDIDLSILPGPATSITFIERDEAKEIAEADIERLGINDFKKVL